MPGFSASFKPAGWTAINRRRLAPWLGAAAGLALALCMIMGFLWTQLESRFIFFPTRELITNPGNAGLSYEEINFTTVEGRRLHGWFIPGKTSGETADETGKNPVTWLWLHGNGGNISHRVEEVAMVHHRLGVNVVIFDYQGYGQSEGKPTEQGVYADARAALKYLEQRPEVTSGRIVYFGRSLGAAVAVNLASVEPPLGLVLVSPFSSVEDMAKLGYPFLPVGWLTRGRFDSVKTIAIVNRPVLIVHGALDDTVPPAQSEKLFHAANQPKRFLLLPRASHNDTSTSGGENYWNALEQFMGDLNNGEPGGDQWAHPAE